MYQLLTTTCKYANTRKRMNMSEGLNTYVFLFHKVFTGYWLRTEHLMALLFIQVRYSKSEVRGSEAI